MAEVNEDWRRVVERGFFIGDGQTLLAFDVVMSEEHTSEVEITENPVEDGGIIADHIIVLPKTLEMEIGISDVTLDPAGFPANDPFSSIVSRSATALDVLEGLQESKSIFNVQTGLKYRQNMVLKRVGAFTDKDSAGVLFGKLSLREVQIVTTESVTFPPRKAGKTHRQASKTVAAGEKQAEQVTDPAKLTSALGDMFGVGTPQGAAIGNTNPELSPDIKRMLGPGS